MKESDNTTDEADSIKSGVSDEDDLFNYNSFEEKYELLEKIGEGANGCVFKCQHKINRKIYAAKRFRVED